MMGRGGAEVGGSILENGRGSFGEMGEDPSGH